jgi:hypothetical protein
VIKVLFLLAVGAVFGYAAGYRDATDRRAPVYDRVVEGVVHRAGGATRGKYDPNVDRQAEAAEAGEGARGAER